MSLFGEDFNLFRIFISHCINLLEESTRLIFFVDLLITRPLKVALILSSSHYLIYFETMLSGLSII